MNYQSSQRSSRPSSGGYSNQQQSQDTVLKQLKDVLGQKDFSELSYEEIAKENGIAEKLGSDQSALKVTQLRKFFDQIKKIESGISDKGWTESVDRDFFMLRPQLAYAKGRDLISGNFYDMMSFCIEKVHTSKNKPEAYRRFASLIEATVAYRKYYETRKGGY